MKRKIFFAGLCLLCEGETLAMEEKSVSVESFNECVKKYKSNLPLKTIRTIGSRGLVRITTDLIKILNDFNDEKKFLQAYPCFLDFLEIEAISRCFPLFGEGAMNKEFMDAYELLIKKHGVTLVDYSKNHQWSERSRFCTLCFLYALHYRVDCWSELDLDLELRSVFYQLAAAIFMSDTKHRCLEKGRNYVKFFRVVCKHTSFLAYIDPDILVEFLRQYVSIKISMYEKETVLKNRLDLAVFTNLESPSVFTDILCLMTLKYDASHAAMNDPYGVSFFTRIMALPEKYIFRLCKYEKAKLQENPEDEGALITRNLFYMLGYMAIRPEFEIPLSLILENMPPLFRKELNGKVCNFLYDKYGYLMALVEGVFRSRFLRGCPGLFYNKKAVIALNSLNESLIPVCRSYIDNFVRSSLTSNFDNLNGKQIDTGVKLIHDAFKLCLFPLVADIYEDLKEKYDFSTFQMDVENFKSIEILKMLNKNFRFSGRKLLQICSALLKNTLSNSKFSDEEMVAAIKGYPSLLRDVIEVGVPHDSSLMKAIFMYYKHYQLSVDDKALEAAAKSDDHALLRTVYNMIPNEDKKRKSSMQNWMLWNENPNVKEFAFFDAIALGNGSYDVYRYYSKLIKSEPERIVDVIRLMILSNFDRLAVIPVIRMIDDQALDKDLFEFSYHYCFSEANRKKVMEQIDALQNRWKLEYFQKEKEGPFYKTVSVVLEHLRDGKKPGFGYLIKNLLFDSDSGLADIDFLLRLWAKLSLEDQLQLLEALGKIDDDDVRKFCKEVTVTPTATEENK